MKSCPTGGQIQPLRKQEPYPQAGSHHCSTAPAASQISNHNCRRMVYSWSASQSCSVHVLRAAESSWNHLIWHDCWKPFWHCPLLIKPAFSWSISKGKPEETSPRPRWDFSNAQLHPQNASCKIWAKICTSAGLIDRNPREQEKNWEK